MQASAALHEANEQPAALKKPGLKMGRRSSSTTERLERAADTAGHASMDTAHSSFSPTALKTSTYVCAACLGSLGLFGNSVLQLIFCYVVSRVVRQPLVIPQRWRHARYFALLQPAPAAIDSRPAPVIAATVPDELALACPIVADRVVLSHPGFRTWISDLQPCTSIAKGLGVASGAELSGRQLRRHFPQITADVLATFARGGLPELVQPPVDSQHLKPEKGVGLWGYFQFSTEHLAPFKEDILDAMPMARDAELRNLMLAALGSMLGLQRPLLRNEVRLVVCHIRRGDFRDLSHHTEDKASFTSGMRSSPPFEDGQSQSWADPSGVFFACPEAWFESALESGLDPLETAAGRGDHHPGIEEPSSSSRPSHRANDCCGTSAKRVDVLWVCTDDEDLALQPHVGKHAAVSWGAAALQPDLRSAAIAAAAVKQQHTKPSAKDQPQPSAARPAAPGSSPLQFLHEAAGHANNADHHDALQLDGLEADFWVMREADVLLCSNSTLSFAAALLSTHHQRQVLPGGFDGAVVQGEHEAGCCDAAATCGNSAAPAVFLRPDAAEGALVRFNPWCALPIIPSRKVPGNHSIHAHRATGQSCTGLR